MSKNFKFSELIKSDTATKKNIDNMPKTMEELDNIQAVIDNVLQPLRDAMKFPIKVNSGYRCKKLNQAVNGAKNSWHLRGKAADITATGADKREKNLEIFDFLLRCKEQKILPLAELIWEGDGKWIHLAIQ